MPQYNDVILCVYDMGHNAYHTSIFVFGKEYSYSSSGVNVQIGIQVNITTVEPL